MVEPRNTTTIIHMYKKINEGISNLVQEYENEFGVGPVWVIRVPARLCIAADHTDYWLGFTPELITMASDSQEMWVVIGARDDSLISCVSSHEKFESWQEEIIDVGNGCENWLDWLAIIGTPEHHWSNYVMGSVHYTKMQHDIKLGFNLYVSSSIPPASGASSSSALAISAMYAIILANNLDLNKDEIIVNTAKGEWFCGTRGGMMDHATMMCAEKGGVLRLTFNPFTSENIELPSTIKNCKFSTLFTHPSQKGAETLLAFNELSLVAREIVPRILNENYTEQWGEMEKKLPQTLTIKQICEKWPHDGNKFQEMYPDLFSNPNLTIRVADRFRFAMRELERSRNMQDLLKNPNCKPESIGEIMDEAWVDAGELYGIRTQLMDEIANRVRLVPGVLGIKVMGAGFGGNLLILSTNDVNLTASGFDSVSECHPGKAASLVDISEIMPSLEGNPPVAAILLCGGKGTRMLNQGITVHKPLLELHGTPSTRLVVEQLINSSLSFAQIIVVVPPERMGDYLQALDDLPVKIIAQNNPLGTGNAVYCALQELLSPIKHAYVSFGTQPLIRSQTITSSLAHHISSDAGFTLPTTLRHEPYAPLIRDDDGIVIGSLETHLDGVEMPSFGETNVGGYWASRNALDCILNKLHQELYDCNAEKYNTSSGELGFPNEMTRGCIEEGMGVEGIAIADPEEVIGLKTPEHIVEIERWLDKRRR